MQSALNRGLIGISCYVQERRHAGTILYCRDYWSVDGLYAYMSWLVCRRGGYQASAEICFAGGHRQRWRGMFCNWWVADFIIDLSKLWIFAKALSRQSSRQLHCQNSVVRQVITVIRLLKKLGKANFSTCRWKRVSRKTHLRRQWFEHWMRMLEKCSKICLLTQRWLCVPAKAIRQGRGICRWHLHAMLKPKKW